MTPVRIPLDKIDVPPGRLRAVDPAWVQVLAAMIAASGQHQPIVVRPRAGSDRYLLVAGEHRLVAVGSNGDPDIRAEVRELTDDEARLVEIDENLIRRELGPLDRALFLAERKRVWERLHPETAHGGNRAEKTGKFQVAKLATRFSADVAEKVGLSERSVQRACDIASGLASDSINDLRSTYLAGHQRDLEAFSKLSPDSQKIALSKLKDGTADTIRAAFGPPGEPAAGPAPVTSEKLLGLWSRTSAKEKRRFLEALGVDQATQDRIVNRRGRREAP